ncbi:4'-phosphopantetheinyl transferase family protein [Streptomyces sp. NPDC001415]
MQVWATQVPLPHSDRFEAYAAEPAPDERAQAARIVTDIAAGFFSPAEYDWWSSAGTTDRIAVRYRAWTRREAYVKATGTGLRDIGRDHHGRGSAWVDIQLERPGHACCVVLLNPRRPPCTSLHAR